MNTRLYLIIFLAFFACLPERGRAQVPDATWQWTWMHGHNTVANYGIYGSRGLPAPANTPGGRGGSFRWTDTSGNFWLFGGGGHGNSAAGSLNDLWKYDVATHEWTWMKGDSIRNAPGRRSAEGVAHPDNTPGGRYGSAHWRDTAGNLWLFGGWGYCGIYSGSLGDLWKYDIASNEWIWIKGDTLPNRLGVYGTKGVPSVNNRPSGRAGTASWTDQSGNFWMFGGTARYRTSSGANGEGELNDLWRYNPATNEWTWMHGDSVTCALSVGGTQGTPAAANTPQGLGLTAFWTDAAGEFWLFGGMNYCTGGRRQFSDLWRYNPATNMWTWVKGMLVVGELPAHGALGVPATANTPGAREMVPATWTDAGGNLWLLGGEGRNGIYNDLWKYEIASNQWTWIKGDNTNVWATTLGVYGTRRVEDPANKPGHREFGPATWIDAQGALWLFGGRSSSSGQGDLNDLWRLAPECVRIAQPATITGPDTICAGQSSVYSISSVGSALSYVWSWPPSWTGSSNDTSVTITPDLTDGTIRVYAANHCDTSDEQYLDITVIEATPLEITVTYDTLGTLTPYAAYQWYKDGQPVAGATNRTLTVYENADYAVKVDNGIGCTDSAVYRVTSFLTGVGFRNEALEAAAVRVWPNPVRDFVQIEVPFSATLMLHGMDGKLILRQDAGSGSIDMSHYTPGVYLLSIINDEGLRVFNVKLQKE